MSLEWFDEVRELEDTGQYCKALDALYDHIDDLFIDEKFQDVDSFISSIKTDNLSDNLILGILTVTRSAADKLPSRSEFFMHAIETLRNRKRPHLLDGLEG